MLKVYFLLLKCLQSGMITDKIKVKNKETTLKDETLISIYLRNIDFLITIYGINKEVSFIICINFTHAYSATTP